MPTNATEDKVKCDLLVFVVGKSGSGKDTIMRKVAAILLMEQIPVNILRRIITRPFDKTEDSLYVSKEEFLQRKAKGEFALSWFVYNNWYGCPRTTLEDPLQQGEIVLVNVSREILYEARKKYPESKIVLIEVPIEIAEKRIKIRGRETASHMAERQARMQEKIEIPTPDNVIWNNGNLDKAVKELSDYLKMLYQKSK